MPKVVGMNGADRLNIPNLTYTFEWYLSNLRWRLSCSFCTKACTHMCMSILLWFRTFFAALSKLHRGNSPAIAKSIDGPHKGWFITVLYKYNKKLGISKHSRDLALLSVLLWYLVLSTTSTCSSTFYQCTTVPTLIKNSLFFVILVCILFLLAYIAITGHHMET